MDTFDINIQADEEPPEPQESCEFGLCSLCEFKTENNCKEQRRVDEYVRRYDYSRER
jgi:hypothetical protein